MYSGKTGKTIHRVVGDVTRDYLGASVARTGDVDGDGIPDFAVGAPQCNSGTGTGCVTPQQGYVRIYSGADASILRQIDGPGPDPFDLGAFGVRMTGGGDVNGDGIGDLLVSGTMEHDGMGALSVVSGATGTFLWKIRRETLSPTSGNYGVFPSMLGDLDHDGDGEFAHGDALADFSADDAGRIWVFEGFPGDATEICSPSPNSVGDGCTLALEGPISVGNNELELRAERAVPGQPGQFVYGAEQAPQPFGDGLLCLGGGPTGVQRLGAIQTIDGAGAAALALDFTKRPLDSGPAAWTPGSTWGIQFVYRDFGGPSGTGFNASAALRVTFVP